MKDSLEQIHSELRDLYGELGDLQASGKTHEHEEYEAVLDRIDAVQNRAVDFDEVKFARMGLKVRGRNRTEARLRELYSQADGEHKGEIVRFLSMWKSKRGLRVADDWMNDDPGDSAFRWILTRYSLCDGITTADRFLSILARKDLADRKRDDAIDTFSDCITFCDRHARYREFLQVIADHLDHPCPEVRWTAIFSIAKLNAKKYRDQLAALREDRTNTEYGYVSAVARNGVKCLDGDEEVDLHDATTP